MFTTLNHKVFWIPFFLVLLSLFLSAIQPELFLDKTTQANNWILKNFGILFSWSTFVFLILLVVIYFSPLGSVRIGGENAKPILSKWKWFSITICTTIATGILFWGAAEPLTHMHAPPAGLGFEKASTGAQDFAMSTMFMHWTFSPYGIYTVGGLLFALCFYNFKQKFSLGALFFPLMGKPVEGNLAHGIDAICLYSLVAGMAASLGTGMLTISGGMNAVFGMTQTTFLLGMIGLVIVATFIASSVSGLKKGIQILSDINIKIFFGLAIFVFITGPTLEMLTFGWNGLKDYVIHFIPRSLSLGNEIDDAWRNGWTTFYFANWMAWAPISTLFLGFLSVGYRVRTFIHFNLIFPSLFSLLWMTIISGTTMSIDLSFGEAFPLNQVMAEEGVQGVIFGLLNYLPWEGVASVVFLFATFLSFVTAADSNTTAMSNISNHGISPENPESPLATKIIWGVLIGGISFVMVSLSGIDGVKMLSNLGGFPALWLFMFVGLSLGKLVWKSFTDIDFFDGKQS